MDKILDQYLINELKERIPNNGDETYLGNNDYININGVFFKSPRVKKNIIYSQRNDFEDFYITNRRIAMNGFNKKVRKKIRDLEHKMEELDDNEKIKETKKEIKYLKDHYLLTLADREVLDELLENLGYNNIIELNVSQASLAEDLGLTPQTVQRSFKKLKNLNIIYYEVIKGRMQKLSLNPQIHWRGAGQVHTNIMSSMREDFGVYKDGRLLPGAWVKYIFPEKESEDVDFSF